MSNTCPPAPTNKKEYITDLGKILVEDYGKKPFYKPEEVEEANKKTKWYSNLDFGCWGMSTYSSHEDFDKYHEQIGETCDYGAMKTEMLSGAVSADNLSWFDFASADLPTIDIDASWLDFGDAFGTIFDGIGEVVSGILEGL